VNHAGNTFASTVSFAGATLANVSIVDADASLLTLQGLTLTGNLNATGTGGIAQGGALNIGGTTTLASRGADINLTNAGNLLTGAVSVNSGRNVTLLSTGAVNLGAVNITGNLGVTSTTSDITNTVSPLIVSGTATFAAAAGTDINLSNVGSNFG